MTKDLRMGKSQPKICSLKSTMNKMLTKNTMQKAQNHAQYHLDKYRWQHLDQNQATIPKKAVIFKVKPGICK